MLTLTQNLQTELVNWTVKHSGHDQRRPYIGLSGISDCEQVIYDRFRHGDRADITMHLRTRISYELEAALIERLKELKIYRPGPQIELFDGLVQGHTDGIVMTDLLEIKTISRESQFPKDKRLPNRAFWQVQAYLHYAGFHWCQVVYLARDTGAMAVYGVRYSENMGTRIAEKIGRLVDAVMESQRPECTCGRCNQNSKGGR